MRLHNETLQHGSPAQFASLAVQADELPMYQDDVNVCNLSVNAQCCIVPAVVIDGAGPALMGCLAILHCSSE